MQSKLQSLIEASTNTFIGFAVSYVANIVVLNAYGFHVGAGKAFTISVIFTGISIVRGYCIRRWFNKRKV